jgi:hypothetical protein
LRCGGGGSLCARPDRQVVVDSAQLSAYLLKVLRPHLPAELWAGARAAAYMFLLCVLVCVCVRATGIRLCSACSCQEILRGATTRARGRAATDRAQRALPLPVLHAGASLRTALRRHLHAAAGPSLLGRFLARDSAAVKPPTHSWVVCGTSAVTDIPGLARNSLRC